MKVTDWRSVDDYIFSSVIAPLKGLENSFHKSSPLVDIEFGIQNEPITRRYRRNYQRERAREQANKDVMLYYKDEEMVVATYNPKAHWVKVYQRPFKVVGAKILLGKFIEAFDLNTPFTKVILEIEKPRQRSMGSRGGDVPESVYRAGRPSFVDRPLTSDDGILTINRSYWGTSDD